MTYWLLLILAGLLETVWAIGLKYADGFTRIWPSVITVVALALSMWLLSWAVRGIPIGTAYPMWVGIGALGTIVLGALLFHEPVSAARLFFATLLLGSLIGLQFTAGSLEHTSSAPVSRPPTRSTDASSPTSQSPPADSPPL